MNELEETLHDFADAVLEQLHMQEEHTVDPFEGYTTHMRAKYHQDPARFRQRFANGYTVLLQELSK